MEGKLEKAVQQSETLKELLENLILVDKEATEISDFIKRVLHTLVGVGK